MSEADVETVRRTLEHWNQGDVEAWLEAAHPDIEYFSEVARRFSGADTVYRGADGLRRFWEEWHSVWDLTLEISEIRDLGAAVVARGRVRTHGGASGIELDGPIGLLYEFEDGLIRKARAYLEP